MACVQNLAYSNTVFGFSVFVFTFVFISKLVCLTELNTVFGKAHTDTRPALHRIIGRAVLLFVWEARMFGLFVRRLGDCFDCFYLQREGPANMHLLPAHA